MINDILIFACPLLLASAGALYSEYTGTLALYLEGLITFCAFLTYALTVTTQNFLLSSFLCTFIIILVCLIFGFLIEKTKANVFIACLGLNLAFLAFSSFFSSLIFGTRGVLTSQSFMFSKQYCLVYSIIITILLLCFGSYILFFTQKGIYFRTTGSDENVLTIKGINTLYYKIASWGFAALFASQAGTLLCIRVSGFVPNISSGRGWMALAAVYLGKKKLWKIILFVLLFCATDYFCANVQNFMPDFPTALHLSLPYLVVLLVSIL